LEIIGAKIGANRLKYVKQKSITEGNSSIGAEQRHEDRWAISCSFDKVPVYSTFKLLITDLGFTRPLLMAGVLHLVGKTAKKN